LRVSQELARLNGVKVLTLWNKSALRRELQGSLFAQGHLGKCFPAFNRSGTQRPLQPWSRGAQLRFELPADLGSVHVMLVLQAHRVQELRGHGGFHSYFKVQSGRPGNVWQSQDP
jgi:hypothetical protein